MKAAKHCLELLNLDEAMGDSPEAKAFRDDWVKAYAHKVLTAVNKHRSYVQNRCKEVCFHWMEEHDGKLPSKADMEACINRTIDISKSYQYEVFKFYWDGLITRAAGNLDDWHQDKRFYLPMSTAAPPNAPNKPYITPSTEAIAVAFVESNRSKWPAIFAVSKKHPSSTTFRCNGALKYDDKGKLVEDELKDPDTRKRNGIILNGKKYLPKFTNPTKGQEEFTGWNKAGRDYFIEMRNANVEARAKPETKALEEGFLALLRADYGKVCNTAEEERAIKRQKTATRKEVEEEDDEDGFDFA